MAQSPGERIAVGYISRTKGVRGEVKVEVLAHSPERFALLDQVVVQKDGRPDRPLTLESWRPDPPGIRVKFAEFNSPEAAKQHLVKGYITVAPDQRAPLPKDVYYVADLIGCAVVSEEDGRSFGEVAEVLQMPTTDVYVVRAAGNEILLPAVGDYIVAVDLAQNRIRVRGVERLLT